ncbi:uncharacterized protein Dwil_GK22884 [Drosophila willistoni]|uniref:DUF4794 domain-containing protein n=1 Tax=Drosophila willistoni TaxID=7260 RepID=B4NNI2_DROWI|nr:extensin [Drosophila willistoni]EDW85921.1 uncharacterized protein Dwil_GK22884 [Drosophila willistoni]
MFYGKVFLWILIYGPTIWLESSGNELTHRIPVWNIQDVFSHIARLPEKQTIVKHKKKKVKSTPQPDKEWPYPYYPSPPLTPLPLPPPYHHYHHHHHPHTTTKPTTKEPVTNPPDTDLCEMYPHLPICTTAPKPITPPPEPDCTLDPNLPSCTTKKPPESDCDLDPTLPTCTTPDICEMYPQLPSCAIKKPPIRITTANREENLNFSIESEPQPLLSLCDRYPGVCKRADEAQFIGLKDEQGYPLILIAPGSASSAGRSTFGSRLKFERRPTPRRKV